MIERRLGILRHALGLIRAKTSYRNHYVTGPGSIDFDDCEAMVAEGLMVRREPNDLWGGNYCFVVTDKGKRVAEPQSTISGGSHEV